MSLKVYDEFKMFHHSRYDNTEKAEEKSLRTCFQAPENLNKSLVVGGTTAHAPKTKCGVSNFELVAAVSAPRSPGKLIGAGDGHCEFFPAHKINSFRKILLHGTAHTHHSLLL
ncbi:hypothetical protein NQ315_015739 [Exocentrus adspersus]|uniref:Uncharacterized protein n=1 Tax=Exocentrus adspersus TaxID=1586481 RepID=A0AAV8W4C7_9CUCU|nr:hypothetical protein NQ315_015739 [Exocentrus adspersus]